MKRFAESMVSAMQPFFIGKVNIAFLIGVFSIGFTRRNTKKA